MVIKDIKKYMREYYQRPDVKAKQREYYQRHADEIKAKQREYRQRPDVKAKRRLGKGNPERLKEICLEYDFSDDIAEAIALDGIVLDKKMKEKGII